MSENPLNPYQSSTTPAVDDAVPSERLPAGPYGPYRDNRILTRWLVGFLLMTAGFNVFWFIVNIMYQTGVPITLTEGFDTFVMQVENASFIDVITFVVFVGGQWIARVLGQNGIKVISRLMGLILAVVGVQMLIEGVRGAVAG